MLKVDTINPFFIAPNKSAWDGGKNSDVYSPIAPIQVPPSTKASTAENP